MPNIRTCNILFFRGQFILRTRTLLRIGKSALAASSLMLIAHCAHSDELEENSLELPIPEVLTPVRLKQPRTEVPASVTVIDRDLIVASGIRELPELLRLVPGMAVGARSGWDYAVSYHGTSRYNSHRMQVLIDGRSVYQAGLATINWDDLPLAMEDIDRIEVTRGPDTAAYGANAFLGIINIITKHPDDSPRWRAKATFGNKSTEDYYASTSGNGDGSSYRVTAAARRDSGFDLNSDRTTERRDSKDPKYIDGRWLVAPMANWALDFQLGYKAGKQTNYYAAEDLTPENEYTDNYFASVNSQHFLNATNSLKWQLDYTGTKNKSEWRTCVLPLCGDVNNNINNARIDLDVQDTWLSDSVWKLVSGFHAQHQNADSETYYSGSVSRSTYQLFANAEFHFLPQWIATIAGSDEYLAHNKHAFSPRTALLFVPSKDHSFRLVYSEAIRSPDLFESDFKWHYIARNVTFLDGTPYAPTLEEPTYYPSGSITYEKIRSRELGYYGLWFNRKIELDIKLFHDSMSDLITDPPKYGGYNPTNTSKSRQTGAETEVDIHFSEALRAHLNAAIINSGVDAYSATYMDAYKEETLTPHKSGSAGLIYNFTTALQWSNFYYYQPISGNTFSLWDTRLAERIPFYAGNITLSATVQHYFNRKSDLLEDNLYNGPNRIYFTADLSF